MTPENQITPDNQPVTEKLENQTTSDNQPVTDKPENQTTPENQPVTTKKEVFYPNEDETTWGESYDHLYAVSTIFETLKEYLKGQKANVFSKQFLYFSNGYPKLRTVPDVMVVFDIEAGGRDSYLLFEELKIPAVIFEVTTKNTRRDDEGFKKVFYEQLKVQECWLFDPKGEWIEEKLQGYRLGEKEYKLITDGRSEPLGLRLKVEDKLLRFYREDTGKKLMISDELRESLSQEVLAKYEAEKRAEELESLLSRYRDRFGELPEN
ncbi:MAG: Uma2 family endonuclease [Okeania sp. SIO3B3]|nr:Uma2 family endonuclease [Okeania sp. SIO3B3]